MSDTEEFEHGTDPNQGIDPLTEDNAFKPWERLGISEDEWNELEKSILEEINPGGWKSFLLGDAAESIDPRRERRDRADPARRHCTGTRTGS